MSKAVIDDKHQRLEHRTLGNAASDWKRAEFKSFPPNKLKSFFSSKSSKCSKTENGCYFFLCSPLLNVDQHEARKKNPSGRQGHTPRTKLDQPARVSGVSFLAGQRASGKDRMTSWCHRRVPGAGGSQRRPRNAELTL